MKTLAISQRVETITEYGERRDCLDQRWLELSSALGFLLAPIPNQLGADVSPYLKAMNWGAIRLSGGNSIASFAPTESNAAPERDDLETKLIDFALKESVPLVGICRGMQMINVRFGGSISKIEGHAGVRHALFCTSGHEGSFPTEVNSYHDWCIRPDDLAPGFEPTARDEEGNIEAFRYAKGNIAGIMWHPERERPFLQRDIDFLQAILN